MSDVSERYRKVAGQFTQRVRAVPHHAWDNPSPCEGWVARDVVGHLVDWMPAFSKGWGVEFPEAPTVQEDPVGAWQAVSDGMQAALDAPEVATAELDTPMGRTSLEQAMARFGIGDVLVHTWDLARATGLDEQLDADEVHRLLGNLEANEELMRRGGQFSPRLEVPEDADEQTKLIAFTGRRPGH